jgi:glutamate dehydrogenase (NAD(P)+)
MHEAGAKIVGLSDMYGAIYDKDGIDVPAALEQVKQTGRLSGLSGVEAVNGMKLLEMPCDILIPAALEGQITEENAPRLQAGLIVEAANGPTTTEADTILAERKIPVVPDILANAGGVTVSYFEWVQDLQSFFWSDDEIHQKLAVIMARAYDNVARLAREHKCDMRTAANMLAIGRVAEATTMRGIYP